MSAFPSTLLISGNDKYHALVECMRQVSRSGGKLAYCIDPYFKGLVETARLQKGFEESLYDHIQGSFLNLFAEAVRKEESSVSHQLYLRHILDDLVIPSIGYARSLQSVIKDYDFYNSAGLFPYVLGRYTPRAILLKRDDTR